MLRNVVLAFIAVGIIGCSDSNYVARVDSQRITPEEFTTYLKVKGVRDDRAENKAGILKQYAQGVALEKAILDEGTVNLAEINQAVSDYRRNMIVSRYFESFINDRVTDDSVKNYFSNHADEYEEERVHVAHILIRTNSGMTEDELQKLKTDIFEIHSKLRSGESFEELANTRSDDKISGKKGGDLGWIKRGSISPIFSSTAFDTAVGTVSDPLLTEYGYHIVKVLEEPKVIRKSLDDVKGEIRHMLKAKAKQAELDRLLSVYDIELNPAGFEQ